MKKTILFDSTLRAHSGRRVPYWDEVYVEHAEDKELRWFHEGYGCMRLYRLHDVDGENFIAEAVGVTCWTSSEHWDEYMDNPELALMRKGATNVG